ncbi:MAG: hypothetical protein WBB96_03440 [Candidatus Dechloromonas phosphoritropha]
MTEFYKAALRNAFFVTALAGGLSSVHAEISIGIGLPSVSIGVNVPVYPRLVAVPGYPVYYDPQANSNYFFYDGLYWVYQDDNWYSSSWYNGPWRSVGPEYVPLFVLRVPVRYYRQPPTYFHGWRADAPPRWGDHWGREWEDRRHGWDHWDRHSAPRAAPLPTYQRQYSGARYPDAADQQHKIRSEHYRYQPHEAVTRQHFQQPQVDESRRRSVQQQRVEPQDRQQRAEPQDRQPAPNQQRERHQPQQQAPVQQRAEPQDRQPPPNQQRQQQSQPAQQREMQRPQNEHRDKGRDQAPGQQDRGGDNRNQGRGQDH